MGWGKNTNYDITLNKTPLNNRQNDCAKILKIFPTSTAKKTLNWNNNDPFSLILDKWGINRNESGREFIVLTYQ